MKRLFRRLTARLKPQERWPPAVTLLYRQIVAQSRQPSFFLDLGVPDTPDGRYDLLMVHMVLVLRRLREEHAVTEELAQDLFDLMFADMDENLREMGIGDLAVGKRVKGMAKALYGRLSAYGEALDAGDGERLAAAVRRNVYRAGEGDARGASPILAAYMMDAADRLARTPIERLVQGEITFPAPPALS